MPLVRYHFIYYVTPFRFNNECTVYVEGLPFTSTEEDLSNFFASVGNIIEMRIPRWHDSGMLEIMAFIECGSLENLVL